MKENHQSSTDNHQSSIPNPPRKRLSSKQIAFFRNVFCANRPVSETLTELRIRLSTFDRWLTKPLFRERLARHIDHYYFEARTELARNAPQAVSGLSFLSEKSLKHKEVRQACNDLLKLHTQYTKTSQAPLLSKEGCPKGGVVSPGTKKAKKGAVLDNFGDVLAKFGNVLDNNGTIKDNLCTTKTTKNPVFGTENQENTKFPRLVTT
jgi:hypothetical protein